MKKRVVAILIALLAVQSLAPPIIVHAAPREASLPSITISSSGGCSCDCITYEEMRQLFEEFQWRQTEESQLTCTMVYNIGWGPSLEELKQEKIYADLESAYDLVDWNYYQPKDLDAQWRRVLTQPSAIAAVNTLGRKLPIFYNIKFNQGDPAPTVQPLHPGINDNIDWYIVGGPPQAQTMADTESIPTIGAGSLPTRQAALSVPKVAIDAGYTLSSKRSLIIMAIYKALGIVYYNKPMTWTADLSPSSIQQFKLVDTPFFSQMPSADLKWNAYTVYNAGGHTYLFMDDNYLEAYMVKAVNDHIISGSDLLPEFRQHIDETYILHDVGGCEDYALFNRSSSAPSVQFPGVRQGDLGIVYNVSDGNISYNYAYQAMNEETGCTVLDFCTYAYRAMVMNGFAPATQSDSQTSIAINGSKLPEDSTGNSLVAVQYLIKEGILESDIAYNTLNSPIDTNYLLILLARLSDKNVRLPVSQELSPVDIEFAASGYSKTSCALTNLDNAPVNLTVKQGESGGATSVSIPYTELQPSSNIRFLSDILPMADDGESNEYAVTEYDYYIPKVKGIMTTRDQGEEQTPQYFSLYAPNISFGWGRQLPDAVIDGRVYMHYRLPVEEPEGYEVQSEEGYYVLNSDNPTDYPIFLSLPPGGGVYEYDKDLYDDPNLRYPLLKKSELEIDVPGIWEGKSTAPSWKTPPRDIEIVAPKAAADEKVPQGRSYGTFALGNSVFWQGSAQGSLTTSSLAPSDQIQLLADEEGTIDVEFLIKSFANTTYAGESLETRFNGVKERDTIILKESESEQITAFYENTNFNGESGWKRVTINVPAKYLNQASGWFGTKEDLDRYSAYISRSDGSLMISSDFLEKECNVNVVERSDGNYITLYSRNSNASSPEYTTAQTTLDLVRGLSVSGSVVTKFGNKRMYLRGSDGSLFFDYRAISAHLNPRYFYFTQSDSVGVEFSADKDSYTYSPLHLWSDNYATFNIGEEASGGSGTGRVNINTIPASISSTVVIRDANNPMSYPSVVQIKPSAGDNIRSESLGSIIQEGTEIFEGNDCIDVDLAASGFAYQPGTEAIWYTPPDKGSYSQSAFMSGSLPLPLYKDGNGYVLANIPFIQDGAGDLSLANTVSCFSVNTTDSTISNGLAQWRENSENTLRDALTGSAFGGHSVNVKHYYVQLFPMGAPVSLHHTSNLAITGEELRQKMVANPSKVLLCVGGGFYKYNQQTRTPDDAEDITMIPASANIGAEDLRYLAYNQIVLSNNVSSRATYSDEELSESVVVVNSGAKFVPLQVVGAEAGTYEIYIGEAELSTIKVGGSGLSPYFEDLNFGTLVNKGKELYESVNSNRLFENQQLQNLDATLLMIYYFLVVVIPRILMASLMCLLALSLVSDYAPVRWFAEHVFDPARILSFGITGITNIHFSTLWLSCALGIALLAIASSQTFQQLFFYIVDQILGIADSIQGNITMIGGS